ncbi:peroxisomal biogenesis factor 19 [Hyalella azteca]|uniref:Peroxin-19 n=1 Tax=Hyalella azteca TaxID=294128 RepID=A0A8B7NIF4_HYAAZ|nr:peroxisomal biogenesis factor 19 [Hyalella azteca]
MSEPEHVSSRKEKDFEIDALLDDALEDFNKPLPSHTTQMTRNAANSTPSPAAGGTQLTEELIKEATQSFEASMRAIMLQQQKVDQVQQLQGINNPNEPGAMSVKLDLQSLTSQFAQFAQSATKVANNTNIPNVVNTNAPSDVNNSATATPGSAANSTTPAAQDATPQTQEEVPDFQNLLAEAMQQMAQNKEAFQSMPSADELSQMMASLGVGGGEDQDTEAAGGLMGLMQSMLENVLSKEIIYPPIKEIVVKYPDWLADNRSRVAAADFDRYSRQYDVMREIVDLFESESESDSDEVKAKRFEDLVALMQKVGV